MLEYLIKIRCRQETTDISYNKFCRWLGPEIEPIEAFYFRHDSHKNPYYDANMKKKVEPMMAQQKQMRATVTGNSKDLIANFMDRIKFQYMTIKKAFMDMDRYRQGFITLDTL